MPSRLKALELHGYKTFASRTIFEFAGTITAIVGPNGSGKSNIADSLRWVLGEQSFSLLRGKKTEDMIFSGSEHRSRASMASATVTFDNSDAWLPIDFSEVSVTRRAYRDGQNEYLINGQKVRLRDITELLSASGLAERTYTVIGQGVVDAALTLKADERRRLFEEAAGIGLHRARREEALRRLDSTRRNLDRVQDILAELRPRLRSLEKQARRAQEYEQVRADLQVLLREWYGFHWHRAQEDLAGAREFVRSQEKNLSEARQKQQGFHRAMEQRRSKIITLRSQINEKQSSLAALHAEREEITRSLAVFEERRNSYAQQIDDQRRQQFQRQEEIALLEQRLMSARQEAEQIEIEWQEARKESIQAREKLIEREQERKSIEQIIQQEQRKVNEQRSALMQIEARSESNHRRIELLGQELKRYTEQLVEHRKHQSEIKLQRDDLASQLARLENQLSAYSSRENELTLLLADERKREQEKSRLLQDLENQISRTDNEIEMLDRAEAALSGYAAGVQTLLGSSTVRQRTKLKGVLSQMLEAPEELETALAAVLGDFLNTVVFDDQTDIDLALDELQQKKARGVLFVSDESNFSPQNINELFNQSKLPRGISGPLIEQIQFKPELNIVARLMFGSTYVADSREAARAMLKLLRSTARQGGFTRVVTLDGEVYYPEGTIIAGGKETVESSRALLERPRRRKYLVKKREEIALEKEQLEAEIRQLRKNIVNWEKELADTQGLLLSARAKQRQLNQDLQVANAAGEARAREINWINQRVSNSTKESDELEVQLKRYAEQKNRLESDLQGLIESLKDKRRNLVELPVEEHQAAAAHWNARLETTERIRTGALRRLDEQEKFLHSAHQSAEQLGGRIDEIEAAIGEVHDQDIALHEQAAGLTQNIQALQSEIDPLSGDLANEEKELDQIQSSEGKARQSLNQAEHNHAQARITLSKRQDALETWRRRIEDDFGLVAFEYSDEVSGPTPLPLSGMVEQLPVITRLSPEIEENVRRQRAQLRRMGAINPEASTEYQEVKERYEFLSSQVNDLEKADKDIRDVILELDALMKMELHKTFEAVAAEFSKIFQRLFGGGSAKLILTDPEDLTQTGIDIEARLPGRRTQGLSLLSGGERSLTAAALIFALLKVSPTPFCILDEVDAMLDEANVGRYREMLRELSGNTQFIVVTHNRNTVQAADVIYGVTMGSDSASQVISLKLDQVAEVVNQN